MVPGISAVVLAAGRSERMGRAKAALPWGRGTLLDGWIARFRQAGIGDIVVVTGEDGAVVRDALEGTAPPGLRWATNPDPAGSGLRESLLLGLDAGPTGSAAFFVPVDVPVVGEGVVTAMLQRWTADVDAFAVVPECHGRTGHPVLASARMVARLYEGERGDRVDELLAWANHRVLRATVDDDRILRDMDTPEDYLMALERGEEREWR